MPALWHAAGTSVQDRKQIIRCLVERVVVVTDRAIERNEVPIVWQGRLTTQPQVARAVGCSQARHQASGRVEPIAHTRFSPFEPETTPCVAVP